MTPSEPQSSDARPPAQRGVVAAVGALTVLELCSGVTQAWTGPLLPDLIARYDISDADVNWIQAVFLLSSVIFVPILSKLGDQFGHRRVLKITAAFVVLGTALVAIAPNFTMLLVGRVIQGALLSFLPLEFAIVRERAGDKAGRGVGLLVGALSIGATFGILISGFIRPHLDLSTSLWIPVVMLALVLPVVLWLVPETTVRKAGRIDWAGAALFALGLLLLMGALGNANRWGWSDPRIVAGLICGPTVLALWVWFERRVESPMVQLSMILRGGLGRPLIISFVFGMQLYGNQAPVTVYASVDPTATGFGLGLGSGGLALLLVAITGSMLVGTQIGPRMVERSGSGWTIFAAGIVSVAGLVLMALFHDGLGPFISWVIVTGVGQGIVFAVLPAMVMHQAPADSVGIATGLYNTTRTTAGGLSGAVFAAVMAAMTLTVSSSGGSTKTQSSEASYVTIWLVCAALGAGLAALGLWDRSTGRRPTTDASTLTAPEAIA